MRYKLRAKRVEMGFKQGEFARELGITPQYLCKIEKGQVEPRRDLILEISEKLGVTVQELFFQND